MSRARLTNILSRDVCGARILAAGLTEPRLRGSVFRILRESVLCSIATVTEKNRAHIHTAYFCYSEERELYFLSHPSALHWGMTIFSSSQPWRRGPQDVAAVVELSERA